MWYYAKYCENKEKLCGKTVVITGGNSGIGKEATKELYKRGARILILCRNEQKSQNIIKEIKSEIQQQDKQHDIIFKKLDLSDFDSVKKCATRILQEEEFVHILINQAGTLLETNKEDYDIHFKVNVFGPALLTLLLLPKIIKSGDSRILNVSSNSHNCPLYGGALNFNHFKPNKWGLGLVQTYCESKTAVVLFTKELAHRLKDAGINNVTVLSYHPGYTNSSVWDNLNNLFFGLKWFVKYCVSWMLLTNEQGAQTIVYCATEPSLKNQSGDYISKCTLSDPNKFTENKEVAKELWEQTLKIINMEDFKIQQ